MLRSLRRLAQALGLLLLPAVLAAQDAQVVDRIIAVVGTKAILQSQVDEQLFVMLAQRGAPKPKTPADSAGLRNGIISDIIDTELLVQEARKDTAIKITEQEVADAVEQYIKRTRTTFTTDAEWRTELRRSGFQSPEEYRRLLGDQHREEFLRNRLVERRQGEGKMKDVPPTEREMRAFYETQKDRLGKRPATVAYHQIVVSPKPGAPARDSVSRLADSLVLALRAGADFAATARRWSEDPGSKELGGSLGWARRGVWVPSFERVAFALRPGFVSDPVETPFGLHIMQVERIQPGEVSVRHILLMPRIDADSITSAEATAERVRTALLAGASFDSLARLYHDAAEQRELGETALDKLAEPYKGLLATAQAGAVTPVTPIEVGPRTKYVVMQVVSRREEGDTVFEDVKDQVRSTLAKQLGVRRYLDRLKGASYVEIRGT